MCAFLPYRVPTGKARSASTAADAVDQHSEVHEGRRLRLRLGSGLRL